MDVNMNIVNKHRLADFTPPNLFLDQETMKHTLEDDEQIKEHIQKKTGHQSHIISAVIAILVPILNLIIENFYSQQVSIPIIVLNGVTILILICIIIWNIKGFSVETTIINRKNGSDKETFAHVIQAVKEKTSYTAVILLALKTGEGDTIKYLCRTPRDDSYFFHCSLDPYKTIEESKDIVKNAIRDTFKIKDTDIREIIPLDQEPMFTVKLVDRTVRSTALLLYFVELDESVKEQVYKLEGNKWKTIDDLLADPNAMKSNYDVINKVHSYHGIYGNTKDSFVPRSESLHVIWNITQSCGYNCFICATKDDKRKELNPEKKLKVLNAIATEKERIKIIDFAGGDPCYSQDSIEIIENAIALFGKDVVSVTTTAIGIKKQDKRIQSRILHNCELTIDASHEYLLYDSQKSIKRGAEGYSRTNAESLEITSDSIRKLTINIPILDDDLNNEEIVRLAQIVKNIKDSYKKNVKVETVLIRLMPVGNNGIIQKKEDYTKYDPLTVAKLIKSELESRDIPCKYHCSLRTLDSLRDDSDSRTCSMLDHKIGIDCAGNVFACAWGGYLPGYDEVKDNPFYLGNLCENDLSEILSVNNGLETYRRIYNQNTYGGNRNYCEVVSRFICPNTRENYDPLAHAHEETE